MNFRYFMTNTQLFRKKYTYDSFANYKVNTEEKVFASVRIQDYIYMEF